MDVPLSNLSQLSTTPVGAKVTVDALNATLGGEKVTGTVGEDSSIHWSNGQVANPDLQDNSVESTTDNILDSLDLEFEFE